MQKGLSKGALERRPWDAHGARRGQGCPGVYEMTASIFGVSGERHLCSTSQYFARLVHAEWEGGASKDIEAGCLGFKSRLLYSSVK